MKTFLIIILFPFLSQAAVKFEKNLAVGYVTFEASCEPEQVQKIAQKFVKDDSHFKIWSVAEIDANSTFGFYFKYQLNDKVKNEDDLADLINRYRKDLGMGPKCGNGQSSLSSKVLFISK